MCSLSHLWVKIQHLHRPTSGEDWTDQEILDLFVHHAADKDLSFGSDCKHLHDHKNSFKDAACCWMTAEEWMFWLQLEQKSQSMTSLLRSTVLSPHISSLLYCQMKVKIRDVVKQRLLCFLADVVKVFLPVTWSVSRLQLWSEFGFVRFGFLCRLHLFALTSSF